MGRVHREANTGAVDTEQTLKEDGMPEATHSLQRPRGAPNPPPIPPGAVAALAAEVDGDVLLPWDEDYAAERAGFNRVAQHQPALIVAAAGAADVRAAVTFAADYGLPVAVQATGHGIAAPTLGGVLISTRRMDHVTVDPVARTARVAAGARWEQVITAAAAHGLAPLNGSSPLVGVVGYTLGGGMGLLARKYGYAADHVTRIAVVTADGRLLSVTEKHLPELFWGLLGGKGNFGVVTAMEFELVPVTRLYGGGLYYDGADAAEVLHAWRRWAADVPEELVTSIALLRLPDLPQVPEFLRARLMVHVRVAHLGSAEEGEELLRPMRAAAPVVLDEVGEMPYTSVADIHRDPVDPMPYNERCITLRELDEAAVDRLLAVAGPGADADDLMVELRLLGGALGRPSPVPNAVGNRDAAFTLATLAPGPTRVLDALAEWGTGGRYLNFLSGPDTADEEWVRACWPPETHARLTALKRAYDPQNLFRANHNILPTPDRGIRHDH